MSGIGFWELVVLFVIGLLILGPERLPRVATQIGRWVGRARRTANQLRFQLEREIALADIEKKSNDRRERDRTPKNPQEPDPPADASDESTGVAEPAATPTSDELADGQSGSADSHTEAVERQRD